MHRFGAAALATAAIACGGPGRVAPPPEVMAKLGPDWFAARAGQLGIDFERAKARDAQLAEDTPPEGLNDDPVLGIEGAVLWKTYCTPCHGPEGEPPEDLVLDPPPKRWGTFGTSMGFFFGGDRMRAGIYRRILKGGEPKDGKPSAMPAWAGTFSREQIWSLVRHIESL